MNLCRLSLSAALLLAFLPTGAAHVVIPPILKPADGDKLAFVLKGIGVQIYECATKKDAPSQTEWVFKGPEAQLSNDVGRIIGKHYGGPTWEGNDGSITVGTVKERDEAPDARAIPWLLLTAASRGNGMFGKVRHIQRVATTGGKAPLPCKAAEVGKTVRVDYMADYYFYTAK